MSLENAHQFVTRMREDDAFRRTAREAAAGGTLSALMQDNGHGCDLQHLVMAMAACMDEMARCSDPAQ